MANKDKNSNKKSDNNIKDKIEANKDNVVELKPATADNNNPNQIKLPDFIAIESTVGAVTMLAAKSQSHKHLFSSDYDWLVIPPIINKQFKLFRGQKNEPIAFVTWASVSEEVEKRLLQGVTKLQPQDWQSGDNLYIIDIITPYNVQAQTLKQLQEKQFQNQEVKLLRPKKDGKGVEGKLLKEVVEKIGEKVATN